MKHIIPVCLTLLVISLLLNIGLVTGYVKFATPDAFKTMAYQANQRAVMAALED